jgi:hypothetical protein
MDKDLATKIAADIAKSGFGSEMRVLKALRNAGWRATGFANYEDLDTGNTRESDIVAHIVLAESAQDDDFNVLYQSFFSLSIEVKKTEKPWVVFKEVPNAPIDLFEGWGGLVFCDGLDKKGRARMGRSLSDTNLAKKLGWFGNGVHEAFKNPDQPSRWYSCFISVCKAAEDNLRRNSWVIEDKQNSNQWPYMWYVKPLVIIDGGLYTAQLDDKNELTISSESMCSVKFKFTSSNYKRREYMIDIVQIDHLNTYLEFCRERHKELTDTLRK